MVNESWAVGGVAVMGEWSGAWVESLGELAASVRPGRHEGCLTFGAGRGRDDDYDDPRSCKAHPHPRTTDGQIAINLCVSGVCGLRGNQGNLLRFCDPRTRWAVKLSPAWLCYAPTRQH